MSSFSRPPNSPGDIECNQKHDCSFAHTTLRYHIGESLLPAIRYFLRYIGLEEEFDQHGQCAPIRSFRTTLSSASTGFCAKV